MEVQNSPPSPANGTANAASKASSTTHHPRRPHLLSRGSSDKGSGALTLNGSAQKSPATPPLPSPSAGRKNSWISGLTSKFSSGAPASAAAPDSNGKASHEKPMPMPQPRRASLTSGSPPPADDLAPYTPATPKSSQPGFFQSALRRFQSSSGQIPGVGKIVGGGGLCERRVMNVDKSRERCRVQGLDQAKLRRVAFCVDVEIAGTPKYRDDEGGERSKKKRKDKDKEKKLKEKGEAEALKHPERVKEEKETDGVVKVSGEQVGPGNAPAGQTHGHEREGAVQPDASNESESPVEGESAKPQDRALEGGSASVDHGKVEGHSPPATPASEARPLKSQDHPTTDPLRIYRRCCQLRETNPLKKVVEQLSAPQRAAAAAPGTVTCLDLCDFWIPLADLVTLADWLAVVPVRKLKLENCGLGDEGVRVVLGGLLASKPLSPAGKVGTKSEHDNGGQDPPRIHGAIEKLSLKNNPKIGRDGWKHISLFLHLCRSIKAVDLSMLPFPPPLTPTQGQGSLLKSVTEKTPAPDMASLLSEAVSERYAGSHLEELILSGCRLETDAVGKILTGLSKSGLRRLGLANNQLASDGLAHVAQFLRNGTCEGLDLGSNDLQETLPLIAEALDDKNPLYGLSLADCNLVPSSLSHLLPALVSLPCFRFIDISHNRNLFSTQPDALSLLRKYLPQLRKLKRIHLEDVALTPDHAIALAEILPESPSLAHLSILENPQLSALASAKDETSQQEACALYASLMAAVRVSETIIRVDIDVPSAESSEVIKALAKHIVAYCLRNMERGPVAEYDTATTSTVTVFDMNETGHPVVMPEALSQLVEQVEGTNQEGRTNDELVPDEEYVLGGTGVVKALGVCLGNTSTDFRQDGGDVSDSVDGNAAAKAVIGKGKAKEMSKNLLGSARKIRARLQPALAKEAKVDDDMSYRRLLFLDQTLQRIIQRFEDEYPECRLPAAAPSSSSSPAAADTVSGDDDNNHSTFTNLADPILMPMSDDDQEAHAVHARPSRHNSDVSLASRALVIEEGQMHRIGQQVRRNIFGSRSSSPAPMPPSPVSTSASVDPDGVSLAPTSTTTTTAATTAISDTTTLTDTPTSTSTTTTTTNPDTSTKAEQDEEEQENRLQSLKRRLEGFGGMELRERMMRDGPDAVYKELGTTADEVQRVCMLDPEFYRIFQQAQDMALRNVAVAAPGAAESS